MLSAMRFVRGSCSTPPWKRTIAFEARSRIVPSIDSRTNDRRTRMTAPTVGPENFPPPDGFRRNAHVKSLEEYHEIYQRSVEDPEGYWAEAAKRIDWLAPPGKVLKWDFHTARVEWYLGGKLNVSANCLDRHVQAGRGGRTAIIWEGNEPSESKSITYADL